MHSDIMPVARGLPPKKCPVCGAKIWGREDKMSVHQAWGIYNSHVHTNHPQYERWNKRISLNYLITVILAVAIPAVVFQIISIDVATLLTVLFWVLALAVGAAIFVVQRKGRERFRDLWNEEHGPPLDPH
jgi:hypothetical protein